jgi:riboflavin kinase/FMN adenylyltransferase
LIKLALEGQRVVTIGTFDGVHPGHQKILQKVAGIARQQGIPSMVMTFYPHPRMVIFPDDHNLKLLSTLSEKEALLQKEGIDELLVLPFTVRILADESGRIC